MPARKEFTASTTLFSPDCKAIFRLIVWCERRDKKMRSILSRIHMEPFLLSRSRQCQRHPPATECHHSRQSINRNSNDNNTSNNNNSNNNNNANPYHNHDIINNNSNNNNNDRKKKVACSPVGAEPSAQVQPRIGDGRRNRISVVLSLSLVACSSLLLSAAKTFAAELVPLTELKLKLNRLRKRPHSLHAILPPPLSPPLPPPPHLLGCTLLYFNSYCCFSPPLFPIHAIHCSLSIFISIVSIWFFVWFRLVLVSLRSAWRRCFQQALNGASTSTRPCFVEQSLAPNWPAWTYDERVGSPNGRSFMTGAGVRGAPAAAGTAAAVTAAVAAAVVAAAITPISMEQRPNGNFAWK